MSYRVEITETAIQDLREIAFHIAEQSRDKKIAKQFVLDLRDQCRRLTDFPQAGAIPKDRFLRSMNYRYLVYKDHLLFYMIHETKHAVNVLAIFHSRKDYMRVMRKYI